MIIKFKNEWAQCTFRAFCYAIPMAIIAILAIKAWMNGTIDCSWFY